MESSAFFARYLMNAQITKANCLSCRAEYTKHSFNCTPFCDRCLVMKLRSMEKSKDADEPLAESLSDA